MAVGLTSGSCSNWLTRSGDWPKPRAKRQGLPGWKTKDVLGFPGTNRFAIRHAKCSRSTRATLICQPMRLMSLMTPDERIDRIRGDHWIAFDRATIVLNRLTSLMEMPQQSRMPGLMVYGSSGIGKTMIAKRMASKYPTQYNANWAPRKRLSCWFRPRPHRTKDASISTSWRRLGRRCGAGIPCPSSRCARSVTFGTWTLGC